MIFIIIFIFTYLAIATLVYGSLIGSLSDVTIRIDPCGLRVSVAALGLFWPIVICIEDARKDVFSKHPLKF